MPFQPRRIDYKTQIRNNPVSKINLRVGEYQHGADAPPSVSPWVHHDLTAQVGDGDPDIFTCPSAYSEDSLEVFINGRWIFDSTKYAETDPAAGTFTLSLTDPEGAAYSLATGDFIAVRYQEVTS